MDPRRSTHVRVEEDLLEAARQEAKERDITFSELYRRALRRELEYPSLIAEIRDLRRDVEDLRVLFPRIDVLTDHVDKNFEFISKMFEILAKHAKMVDNHVKGGE